MLTAATVNRPTDDPGLMTQEGYDQWHSELETLTTTARRELAERLRDARAAGTNPAENGALIDALDESALLEQRIGALKSRLATARVAAPAARDGVAAIGTRVGLRTGDQIDVDAPRRRVRLGVVSVEPCRGRLANAA